MFCTAPNGHNPRISGTIPGYPVFRSEAPATTITTTAI
jgi:hypothetical protein